MLGGSAPLEECQAMKGLIAEGEDVINATGDPAAKDAALIAAAQRVEHYEIAAYGTARTLSDQLGMGDAAGLLDQTLNEESHADELLNKLATGGMFLWDQREGVGVTPSLTMTSQGWPQESRPPLANDHMARAYRPKRRRATST